MRGGVMNRQERYHITINDPAMEYHGSRWVILADIADNFVEGIPVIGHVVYSAACHAITGYHCCSSVDSNGMLFIHIGDRYRNIIAKEGIFRAILAHEIGHFINGDFNDEKEQDINRQIKRERTKYANSEQVMPMELLADRHVVECYGKSAAVNMLNYLIQQRKQRDDSGAAIAIAEMQKRIKAIQRMK